MIHENYGRRGFAKIAPGTYLGYSTEFHDRKIGDIITCSPNPDPEGYGDHYYLDPDLKIEGSHYVLSSEKKWIRIYTLKEKRGD